MKLTDGLSRVESKKEKLLNLNSNDRKLIENIDSKELGVIIKDNMDFKDLFEAQRRKYNIVENPKKEINYYDI
jgi:hypothetical protein